MISQNPLHSSRAPTVLRSTYRKLLRHDTETTVHVKNRNKCFDIGSDRQFGIANLNDKNESSGSQNGLNKQSASNL